MACTLRTNTGHCQHHQCQYSDQTPHGYECVDIIGGQYCEVGDGCIAMCPYSYRMTAEIREKIQTALDAEYPEYAQARRAEAQKAEGE